MTRAIRSCLLVLALISPLPASSEAPGPHIRVTGVGVVETVPDMATFRVGISEHGYDIEGLKGTIDQHTRELMALVSKLDIPREDVTSAQIFIHPQYDWDDSLRNFAGYLVGREVEIILRDLDRFSALVDGIIQAGATELSNIELGTSRKEALGDQALRLAVRNGRAEAELLAKAAGTAIENIYQMTAHGQNGPIMMRSQVSAEALNAAPVFEPGTISIRRQVELIYLLE